MYEVQLHITIEGKHMELMPLGDLGPTTEPVELQDASRWLGDGISAWVRHQQGKITTPRDKSQIAKAWNEAASSVKVVATLFTDANGVEWVRTRAGRLVRRPTTEYLLTLISAPSESPN
ncbi:hypothetical protein CF166_24800 [Amycolatopsis sp. KNN50.9b]|nr:hypothetical protein CF166_24800 [Amycolatopsis sp. KNN50.9b]